MNIYQAAAFHGLRQPNKPALVDVNCSLNFSEFVERIQQVAAALQGMGIVRGDRVCVMMHNSIDQVALYHATALLGFILVPIYVRYDHSDLIHELSNCQPRIVIFAEEFSERIARVRAQLVTDVESWIVLDDKTFVAEPNFDYTTTRNGCVEPDDVALILYTSGTTSAPKGAMLTHGNLVWNSINYVIELEISRHSTAMLATPLFHIGGFGVLNGPVLYAGGTLYIVSKFEPRELLASLKQVQPTHLFLLSTMWVALTDLPEFDEATFENVTYVQTAASPLSDWRRQKIEKVFCNAEFGWGFGMTETCVTTIKNRTTAEITSHPGSIGYVWRNVAVRLVDLDGNVISQPDTPGELQIKSPTVFAGYWNDPDGTADLFTEDGWLKTGDLLEFDAEGFAYFRGRRKDMIKTGGENVAALEVEQCLTEHTGVSQAAVLGLPHEYWGELLVAAVLLKPDETPSESDLVAHCKARLSPFKVPKRVFLVDQMPYSSSGKIQKHVLRGQLEEILAAEQRGSHAE